MGQKTVMANAMLGRSRLRPPAMEELLGSRVLATAIAGPRRSAVRWLAWEPSRISAIGHLASKLSTLSPRSSAFAAAHVNDSGKSCDIAYYEAAHKWEGDGWSTVFSHGSSYCCPATSQRPLSNCHWVGKGDCADNTCSASEVTLLVDNRGDSYSGCNCEEAFSLLCQMTFFIYLFIYLS